MSSERFRWNRWSSNRQAEKFAYEAKSRRSANDEAIYSLVTNWFAKFADEL